MSDLYTKCYLLPEQVRFLLSLTRWLRRILAGNRRLNPDQLMQASQVLDVLEGWLPYDAGTGCIRLEIFSYGELAVNILPDFISVRFRPWHPVPFKAAYCEVMTTGESSGQLADKAVQKWVHHLLRRADYRSGPDFMGYGQLKVEWQWDKLPAPSPAPHWVALREQARQQGGQPPRAIHWLLDSKGTGA